MVPSIFKMASYAAIASKPGLPPLPLVVANPVVANPVVANPIIEEQQTLEKEITEWIALMGQVTTAPEQLSRLVEVLRREMEAPSGISGFRGHTTTESKAKAAGDLSFAENTKSSSNQRNFKNSASASASHQYTTSNQNPNWRSGFSNSRFGNNSSSSAFDTRGSFDHGSKDHGSKDYGSKDYGSKDHGSKDHGSKDHGSKDHGSKDHGSKDHGSKQSTPLNNKIPFASIPLEQPMTVVRPRASNPGRYKSRFKSTGNIEDKILNTIIGNKLNAFTPLTYNDTRDFIYQIMESGDQGSKDQGSKEKEFTRDFIEKVFVKAVVEDLYCALFAKLIAEIAHRYPVIYEEMNKYHTEFLMIFDNVQEDTDAEYTELVKQKQYRMGYGQFIAELAGLNALETSHLMTMVSTIIDKIYKYSADENKVKTVEEFIDCLVRLTKGLQTRSPTFFKSVKGELVNILAKKLEEIIARPTSNLASKDLASKDLGSKDAGPKDAGPNNQRPSLSNKARFGLMDLKDIIQ